MPFLAFNLNDGNEFIFDLVEDRLSLGRNQRNEIVIDNVQVSSFHAEFVRQADGAYILTDLKSSNGTFVNDRRIESAPLSAGDRIRFGIVEARFRDTKPPEGNGTKSAAKIKAEEMAADRTSPDDRQTKTGAIPLGKAPDAPAQAQVITVKKTAPPAMSSQARQPDEKEREQLAAQVAELRRELGNLNAEKVLREKTRLETIQSGEQARENLLALSRQMEEAGESLRKRQQQDAELKEQSEKLLGEINRHKTQLADLTQNAEKLRLVHEELKSATSKKSEAEASLKSLKEEHEATAKQLAEASEKLRILLEKNATQEASLKKLQEQSEQAGLNHAGRLSEMERTSLARSDDLRKREAEIESAEKSLAGLRQNIAGLETLKGRLAEDTERLATLRDSLESEAARFTEIGDQQRRELDEAGTRKTELQAASSALQKDLDAARARFEEFRKLNQEMEEALSSRKKASERDLVDKESAVRALEDKITRLGQREAELEEKSQLLASIEARLGKATQTLAQTEEQKAALEKQIPSLIKSRDEFAQKEASLHAHLEGLERQKADLEKQVGLLEKNSKAAGAKLAEAESRAAELEKTSSGLIAQAENARNTAARITAEIASHQKTLSETVAVKEKLIAEEEAIKSRVGEASEKLEQTLSRIREHEALDREAEIKGQKKKTRLDELSAAVAEKEAAIATLEKKQAVLEESAEKSAAEETASRKKLAELEKLISKAGQKLEKQNSALAKAEASHADMLEQCRKLKQQKKELDETLAREKEAMDTVTTARSIKSKVRARTTLAEKEQEALLAKVVQLQQETAASEASLVSLNREHEAEKLRLQQTRDHHQLEQRRAEGLRRETAILLETLQTRQKELSALETKTQEARARLAGAEERAGELRDLETHVVQARKELDTLESRHHEQLRVIKEFHASRESLTDEMALLENEVACRKADAEGARGEMLLRREQLEGIKTEISELRDALQQLNNEHAKAARDLLSARAEAEAARTETEELKLAVAAARNAAHELAGRRSADESIVSRLEMDKADLLEQIETTRRELSRIASQREQDTAELVRLQQRIQQEEKLQTVVRELEEKRELLQRHLNASREEQTVLLFANDIIKRIDLIDVLVQRAAAQDAGDGMQRQLRTLRASFNDILSQHGVSEFTVAVGTGLDINLRQRITVMESIPGSGQPRVVECGRPGFVFTAQDGREILLRKVEVRTSSQHT